MARCNGICWHIWLVCKPELCGPIPEAPFSQSGYPVAGGNFDCTKASLTWPPFWRRRLSIRGYILAALMISYR